MIEFDEWLSKNRMEQMEGYYSNGDMHWFAEQAWKGCLKSEGLVPLSEIIKLLEEFAEKNKNNIGSLRDYCIIRDFITEFKLKLTAKGSVQDSEKGG